MTTEYRFGQFVWRELFTQDVAASLRFYAETFGWKIDAVKMPDGTDYQYCKVGETGVGGIMKHPMAGVPSFWGGSVSVEDVDAAAARVTSAGGKIIVPAMEAGGMGRYAGCMDPDGAVFNLWKGVKGDSPAVQRRGPGEFCWDQLNTPAPDKALAFYGAVLGWTNKPFGSGEMKVFEAGAAQVASVMQTPPGVPAHWLTYVVVDKLADARDRVTQHGGKIMFEQMEIKTVGTISVVQDNVGAVLGLFENPA